MVWKCSQCGKIEGDERAIIIRKIPHAMKSLLSFLGVHSSNLDEDHFLLNIADIVLRPEQKKQVVQVRVRCHHCGKPLCQEHSILVEDNVFSLDNEENPYFSPEWWTDLVGWRNTQILMSLVQKKPSQIMPKAYHCEDCWQRYHPGVIPSDEYLY